LEPREKGTHTVILKGIVVPVDWDEAGNILSLAIATNTEEELRIRNDTNGKKLFNHLREQVEVLAEISDVAGEKILHILEFHSL
jgi:hypothetical protein